MGKLESKGSAFYDSCPRMNPCKEEPAWESLKAAIRDMRALSRGGMSERSHKGAAAVNGAVNGDLRPVQVPNIKGKTPLLSTFDGQDSRNFIPWLIGIKSYFEGNHLSDSEKCKVGVSCLKGSALVWLTTLNMSRFTNGKGTIKSWHKLEFHMKEKYTPFCDMPDLKTTKENRRQNLLSTNRNAKPCEKPQPDIESKLVTVTTCLKPKPETFEQTELEMACSPTEVNHVSDASIVRCLSPLKNDSMIVDHEEDDESPALTSSKPSKLSKKDLPLTHCENKDQFPNLSPNETISNHMLFKCQTKIDNQPISPSITEIHGSLVKQGSRESPYFPLCPRVCHLASDLKPHPIFETCTVKGKSPDLATPHFHFYMLVRLQDSLVHLSANPYILERKNGGMAQFENCCPTLKLLSYGKFQGFEYHCCALFEMEKGLSTSEMFILRISKWKLIVNGEMEQFGNCCPVLKFLCSKVNLVQMHCEHLLEVLGISGASSPHDFGGVLALLVMFVLRITHKNSSSPSIAFMCSNGCVDSYHGLSLGAYMLLVVAELLSATPMSPKQAIMVFDPGGRHVISVHEIIIALLIKRCEEIFFSYNQNLRSNSFEPGEVAAGAKGRALSFLMPKEQSMEQLQMNAINWMKFNIAF